MYNRTEFVVYIKKGVVILLIVHAWTCLVLYSEIHSACNLYKSQLPICEK